MLNLTLSRLFRLQDERLLIFPLALINLFLSIVLYDSEIKWGNVWPLWNGIANFAPLLLLTLIALIKGPDKKSKAVGE
ncbi:hypothetical protein ACFPYJ_26070 [Paenibacillus solisilvae]|uniref:Holin n=1 Tax=Paenibacillus solisilvae TaxID=2486751 RepID=A0ABW0W4B9_9BACL